MWWWAMLVMIGSLGSEAQEVRIPAYGSRIPNRPVLRIIPSDSVVIRVRKPDQVKPGVVTLRDSSIHRVQPILHVPKVALRVDLGDTLAHMRLMNMASLVRRTKLQSYLQETGPVTLFAPTDEAFSLMTPPNDPRTLRDFVLQHAVKGRITLQDVRNDVTIPSLRSGNRPLRFNVYDDGQMFTVSGSQFLDDETDAGSIRIQPIDRVLYPISNEDLVTEVKLTFPRLHEFLLNSSLTSQLTSGTFTLFAPTDGAFDALTPEVRDKLFHNPILLRRVLMNHVVPGTHFSAVLAHDHALRSLGGEPIHFTNRRGIILANGIPVVKPDISVNNGVIHAVNRLLLPPELHTRRRPATVAPPPRRTSTPVPSHHIYIPPVPTYIEPAPPIPRTLIKTMTAPLHFPDGRNATFSTANSLFRRSLILSNLRNNATDEGYTILMPTDGAFNSLEPGTLDRMRRNTRLLRRMLLCQMIEGQLNMSNADGKDRPIRSLGGTIIISSVDGGKSLMAGGARVLSIRPAANGLVLVTDRVSFPPPEKSVVEALTPLTGLKRFVDRRPDIQSTLTSGEATYTVFAPTDAALATLQPHQQQDPQFLSELFWSHVVPGAYYRSRLAPGLQLTTLRGNIITIQRPPTGVILVNNFPLSGDEILAGNGVIHKMDTILFTPALQQPALPSESAKPLPVPEPEEDDLARIARIFNATQFLQWMEKAQMRDILRTQVLRSGGCTLFLPTNDALNSMSPTLRSVTLGDVRRLQKFIRFHLSPLTFRWDSIRNNAFLPTLLPGKKIRCNIYAKDRQPGVLSVSGCRVSAMRPLDSDNNITVAVIEGTMAPPGGNMILTASKTPILSNFSKILKVAAAEDIISGGGPYTLFAPNSCVFSKMDPEEYRRLITHKKAAREFVKRHLVRGCYYSSGLYDGQKLMTEAGTELILSVTPDCILVSGTKVLYGDMSTTDGVLHVIACQIPS